MTDITTLQAQLAALKKARASGASSISFDGKTTTFRSDASLQAAIAAVQGEINALEGKRPTLTVVRSTKGW